MIQINLFPVRQIKKRIKARNEVMGFVLMLALLGAILGGHTWTMAQTADKINCQIKEFEKKKADNQHILNQIKELKQAKLNLETKLDVIKKLKINVIILIFFTYF